MFIKTTESVCIKKGFIINIRKYGDWAEFRRPLIYEYIKKEGGPTQIPGGHRGRPLSLPTNAHQ